MNEVIVRAVDGIDKNFKCIKMDFKDATWRNEIPSEPGWYLIKTDTPVSVLSSVGIPKYKNHINIPNTINAASELREAGIVIAPKSDAETYVAYNGETKNLKARAREHENGHPKTFCLGLSNYNSLFGYNWEFCYATVLNCIVLKNSKMSCKLLRLAIEQAWRVKHGWPILSKK